MGSLCVANHNVQAVASCRKQVLKLEPQKSTSLRTLHGHGNKSASDLETFPLLQVELPVSALLVYQPSRQRQGPRQAAGQPRVESRVRSARLGARRAVDARIWAVRVLRGVLYVADEVALPVLGERPPDVLAQAPVGDRCLPAASGELGCGRQAVQATEQLLARITGNMDGRVPCAGPRMSDNSTRHLDHWPHVPPVCHSARRT